MENILLAKNKQEQKETERIVFCPSFYVACPICGPAHASVKEGGLFCFVVMRFTELGCFRSCS